MKRQLEGNVTHLGDLLAHVDELAWWRPVASFGREMEQPNSSKAIETNDPRRESDAKLSKCRWPTMPKLVLLGLASSVSLSTVRRSR